MYHFLILSILPFVLSQPASDCLYNVTDSKHCSKICVPFHHDLERQPTGSELCFDFNITPSENHNTYLQVILLHESHFCQGLRLGIMEAAIQAIDREGFPVGQWEVGAGNAIFSDHCTLDPKQVSSVLDITTIPCPRTTSLQGLYPNVADTPNYVLLDQTNRLRPIEPTDKLGMLWHYEGCRSINVTFIAEIRAARTDVLGFTIPADISFRPNTFHTLGNFRKFYEYHPKPQPPPVIPLKRCFSFTFAQAKAKETFIEHELPHGLLGRIGFKPNEEYMNIAFAATTPNCITLGSPVRHCTFMCKQFHPDAASSIARPINIETLGCGYEFIIVPVKNFTNRLIVTFKLMNNPPSTIFDCRRIYDSRQVAIQAFDINGFPFGNWLAQETINFITDGSHCSINETTKSWCNVSPTEWSERTEPECLVTAGMRFSFHILGPPNYFLYEGSASSTRRSPNQYCGVWFHNSSGRNTQFPGGLLSVTFVAEMRLGYLRNQNSRDPTRDYVLRFISRTMSINFDPIGGALMRNKPDPSGRPAWDCFNEEEFQFSQAFTLIADGIRAPFRRDPKTDLRYITELVNNNTGPTQPFPSPCRPTPTTRTPTRTSTTTIAPSTLTTKATSLFSTTITSKTALPTTTTLTTTSTITSLSNLTTTVFRTRFPRTPSTPRPTIPPRSLMTITPPTTMPSPEILEKVSKKQKNIYERCELTKKCIASSLDLDGIGRPVAGQGQNSLDSCIKTKTCDVMISYGSIDEEFQILEDEVYIELVGKSNFWVAIGLSHDDFMGNDFVMECVRSSNEEIDMYTSWNFQLPKYNNKRMNRSDPKYSNFIKLHDKGFTDGYIFCKFCVKKVLFYDNPIENNTRHDFHLERTLYFILMASGEFNEVNLFGAEGNLNRHGPGRRFRTAFKVAIGARFSPTPSQQRLIVLHGQIMIIAFLFFIPNALFIARYFKETFTNTRCGWPDWLLWHTILQVVGFLLIIGGHVCLTFANHGWTTPVDADSVSYHLWTGLTTDTLFLFNTLIGFLDRERTISASCDMCHWVHASFGHAAYLFGMTLLVATFLRAERVLYSDLPCATTHMIIIWIVIYCCFHIIMSYHYCWVDWIDGATGRAYSLGPLNILIQREAVIVAPGKRLRIILFIAFLAISGVMSITTTIIAGTGTSENACFTVDFFLELN